MRAFLFACAMILFVAFNFAFAAEKSEGGASASAAVGGANSPIYSQVEIDAKLSQLESEALNQREVAGLRVDHLEKQIAESKRYIDRILLMFVVSCALIIFLVVNNMRHQQRGASQKMRRLIKDAEDAVGEVRRHLDRPEADHMRAGRALRVVMRRLRDGSAMALPQHLSRQVVSAAADAYLPAGLHLMANALRAEQAGSWREAAVYLERLNAMEDGDPDVLLHLAHVYKNLADDNPGEDGKSYLRLSLQYYQRFALRDKENREVARGETAESAAHFEDKDKIPELEEKKRARLSAMPMPPMPQSSGNGAGKEQSNRAPAASEKSNGSGKSTETISARSTPIPPSSPPIVEAKPPLQVREKPVVTPPSATKIESPPELPKASPPSPALKIESPPELPKASPSPQAREKPVIAPPSATKIESPPELPKASPPPQAQEKLVIAPPAMKIESPPELPKANLPPQAQEKPVIAPPSAMKIESPPELPKASPPLQAREKPVIAPPSAMKIESPPELPKASPPPQVREKPVIAPPSATKIESPPELPKASPPLQAREKPVIAPPPPATKIESPPELPKANLPLQAREKPVVAPPPAMKIESPPELPKASPPPQAQEKPVIAPPPAMKIESPPELPKASPPLQAREKPVIAPSPAMKIESPPELPKASLPSQAQEKPVVAPPPVMKIESPPELPKANLPSQAQEKPVVAPPPEMPKANLPPQAQEKPVVAPTMATKTEPAESRLKLAEAKKRTEESSLSEIVPPTNSANDSPTISAPSAPPPKTQMRVGDILRARFRKKASEKKRAPIPIAETTDESPEGQMRALVQQANELLARAQDSKSSREKRRLLDQALNIFEQAQRQKTSEMLYYHWGIALLARALDSPTRQRERWFANAADKFKAGNVLAPKAFDFRLASLYAIADDEENCRRWLVAAAESGQLDSAALVRDPDFEAMRAKPWFRQYLADAA